MVCDGLERKSLNILVYMGSMPRIQPEQAKAIILALDNERDALVGGSKNVSDAGKSEHELRALWLLPRKQREALARASLMIADDDMRREALLRRHSPTMSTTSRSSASSVGGARGLGGALPGREFPQSMRLLSTDKDENSLFITALASDEVDVVLSHCDSAVVQEALLFARPVLCIPFFGDHYDVAQRLRESGAGMSVDKLAIDPQEMRRTLVEMGAGLKALHPKARSPSVSSKHSRSTVLLPGSRAARRAAASLREAIADASVSDRTLKKHSPAQN